MVTCHVDDILLVPHVTISLAFFIRAVLTIVFVYSAELIIQAAILIDIFRMGFIHVRVHITVIQTATIVVPCVVNLVLSKTQPSSFLPSLTLSMAEKTGVDLFNMIVRNGRKSLARLLSPAE